eukprot:gene40539-59277_t
MAAISIPAESPATAAALCIATRSIYECDYPDVLRTFIKRCVGFDAREVDPEKMTEEQRAMEDWKSKQTEAEVEVARHWGGAVGWVLEKHSATIERVAMHSAAAVAGLSAGMEIA